MIDFLINRLKKFKAELNGNSSEDFAANALTSSSLVVNSSDLIAGYISGNLKFNSPATPPIVGAGIRNVVGIPVQETADVALATTDAFSLCSQTFGDYLDTWMKVLVNSSGVYKYIPSFDSFAVPGLTDIIPTNISVTSGTATVTATTTGLVAGHMIYLPIDGEGTIIGKAFNVTGTTFDVKTTLSNGTTYTSATGYSAKYRVATYHGTGTLTGINTDPGIVGIYSPSPEFNPVYNGYYRDTNGAIDITATGVWRDLGAFYIDASGNVLKDIISYGSGNKKNDNILKANTFSAWASTDTVIPRFANWEKMWGSDTILYDNATEGTKVILQKTFKFALNWNASSSGDSAIAAGITVNDTERTTSVILKTNLDEIIGNLAHVAQLGAGNSSAPPASFAGVRYKSDVLRPSSTGIGAGTASRWNFSFEEL